MTKFEFYINNCKWGEINFPSGKDDWKKNKTKKGLNHIKKYVINYSM